MPKQVKKVKDRKIKKLKYKCPDCNKDLNFSCAGVFESVIVHCECGLSWQFTFKEFMENLE